MVERSPSRSSEITRSTASGRASLRDATSPLQRRLDTANADRRDNGRVRYAFDMCDACRDAGRRGKDLRRSQRWLRMATVEALGLADLYKQLWEDTGKQNSNAFRRARFYRAHPTMIPFADPFHWAGFIFAGA
jgi:hypothetical protein